MTGNAPGAPEPTAPIHPLSTFPLRLDSAIPSLDQAANAIGLHLIADAIEAYQSATHRAGVISDRLGRDGADHYRMAAETGRRCAAEALLHAILSHHVPDYRSHGGLAGRQPTVGVAYQGTLYAAMPRREFAHLSVGEVAAGRKVMCLAVDDANQQQAAYDLAKVVNLDAFFGTTADHSRVTIDRVELAAVGMQPQPAPAHISAVWIEGRMFRLCFWSESEWRALPFDAREDKRFSRLSNFGMVSLERIAQGNLGEWVNTVKESCGEAADGTEHREFEDLRRRLGDTGTRDLMGVIKQYGPQKALSLLKRHLADADEDARYWDEAADFDLAKKSREQEDAPSYFRVTIEDSEQLFAARHGLTLDDVIADQAREAERDVSRELCDRAVWRDNKLLAVVSRRQNGPPVVTRFDQAGAPCPAPAEAAKSKATAKAQCGR